MWRGDGSEIMAHWCRVLSLKGELMNPNDVKTCAFADFKACGSECTKDSALLSS
jgi:hypothetical protein